MRKFWMGLALTGLVVVSATAGAWASTGIRRQVEVEYQDIKISVNGKTVDVGASEPFLVIEQGRTFVPARPLAEALGASVSWDQANSTVVVYGNDYVKSTIDQEYRVWSMPAQGMSIKAPRSFTRLDIGVGLFQLGLFDLTGPKGLVVVNRADVLPDGRTPEERLDDTLSGLTTLFMPDALVTGSAADGNKLTVSGTTTILGDTPAAFTLRSITDGKSDWIVLTLVPTSLQAQMGPVMEDLLASFTLETK